MYLCPTLLQLHLERDAHFSLFEFYDDHFRILDDTLQLSKLLQKWPQDNPFTGMMTLASYSTYPSRPLIRLAITIAGPRKLYFKRYLRMPDSASDIDERDATSLDNGAFRLALAESLYWFRHGTYRFDCDVTCKIAALAMYAVRGPSGAQDTALRLRPFIHNLLPAYTVSDFPTDHPRCRGTGKVSNPLTLDSATRKVLEEYKGLQDFLTQFEAQKQIVALCREHPLYGHEFFYGTRNWKESEPQPDGTVKEIARQEAVVCCTGHEGLHYLLMDDDPLAITSFEYGLMVQWRVSRDGRIFAFGTEEGEKYYIYTDVALYLEDSCNKYTAEIVAAMPKAGAEEEGSDRSKVPRPEGSFGSLPSLVRVCPAPQVGWEDVPWPLPEGADPTADLDTSVLPDGWLALRDAEGDTYYFHEQSGKRQWSHPLAPQLPLPLGWTEATDPQTGDTFFYHAQTGQSTWERPLPDLCDIEPADMYLEPGWRVRVDGEGDEYFYHLGTGESRWEKPRDTAAPSLLESYLRHKKVMEAKIAARLAASQAKNGERVAPSS